MSIFGHPVGVCDWCGSTGIKLSRYLDKDVCSACQEELSDGERAKGKERETEEIRQLISRANKNYNT
jgi:hypothetical protein